LPAITETTLLDSAELGIWGELLAQRLNDKSGASLSYTVAVNNDENSNQFGLTITKKMHGIYTKYKLSSEFFNSGDYKVIAKFVEQSIDLLTEGSFISRGERKLSVQKFSEVYNWLMKEARKGLNIQRYKGLGEMNPDQLWETTMDPENRRLLQVRIEDAVAADEVFTTLMGDHVEPRRIFIESNALNVNNLDV
jgi:DNA gyrase subunit B